MSIYSVNVDLSNPVVDLDHLELLVGPDFEESEALLDDLISLFEEENEPHLNLLENACEISDVDATIKHVHFIAGSSGNMGLARLSKYCRAVERSVRDQTESPSPEHSSVVRELYQSSIAAFKEIR